MDILSHSLWGAVGAKALNRALEKGGRAVRLKVWQTGFWGAFPDLLAFTPLALFIVWSAVFGEATLEHFRSGAPDAYLTPLQYALRTLTSVLYPLSHSLITWGVAFAIVWAVLRRPAWELLGWFSHIVIDIGTHPAEFYPTPFLWPVSELRLDGISWATPGFLVINYALILSLLYYLRDHHDIREGFRAMTRMKKILLGFLIIAAIAGAWMTFDRRAVNRVPPPQKEEEPATVAETMTVQVFFSNSTFDPNMEACNRTYPVSRTIPKTVTVGRASLEELLKGPTAEEAAQGYSTSINDGVKVRSLAIRDGVAYADFDARLGEGVGGSCRVAAIRSQITNTLKQFPTVREVVLSVEGRVEDVLQP